MQEPKTEDNLYGTVCTGVKADGRCWFLSELGESCETTCENHGRVFSYVIPSKEVTPRLVGHKPKQKQEPWVALECYSPSEDRYHPVNPNAARHSVDDADSWSHENCKLACPCGGSITQKCSWQPAPECVPKFVWKGVEYSGCATVDMHHDKPWCQHNYQHTEKDEGTQDWSYCSHECTTEQVTEPKEEEATEAKQEAHEAPKEEEAAAPKQEEAAAPKEEVVVAPKQEEECGWVLADGCVSEFDYKGVHYVGCTGTDEMRQWCSTTDLYQGLWKSCSYSCTKKVPVVPRQDDGCGWVLADTCVKEFDYKGVHYVGCTGTDETSKWCSTTDPYQGLWSQCSYSCAAKVPVPVNQETALDGTCRWTPAASCVKEFDYQGTHYVGCTVADDETPWCSNTGIYKGSWNRCTYTCPHPVPPGSEKPLERTMCKWQPNEACVDSFEYKGLQYSSCVEQDYPTPWCSLDKVHRGSFAVCTQVCGGAAIGAPVAPVPQPPAPPVPEPVSPPQPPAPPLPKPVVPVPAESQDSSSPCYRKDTEDDLVGSSVTLDEVGYKIVATAGSTTDIKRFICRVVSSIACKVVDRSALMDFAPQYIGPVTETKNYKHLKTELTSLCNGGGKWVIPNLSQ